MKEKKIKDIIIKTDNGKLMVVLKKVFYEKEAVFAAAYKFTDLCSILIEPIDDDSVGIYFEKLEGKTVNLKELAKKYCNEILDQQVRLDLEKRYGNIRDLIYKHAFTPLKNLDEKVKINGK